MLDMVQTKQSPIFNGEMFHCRMQINGECHRPRYIMVRTMLAAAVKRRSIPLCSATS
jgi:hypothetical protein